VIYYLDHVDCIHEEEISDLLPFLSRQRCETVARYRFAKDRVQSVLAYLLLRYGLARGYGILSVPRICRTPQGKPFLQEDSHIHFNLSHCQKAVACGFSSAPIGVDVQHMVPYKESIAKFFMTPQERMQAVLGDSERAFTRLWTLKEAYGKYSGEGICYTMSETPVTEGRTADGCLLMSYPMDGYYLSVCSREEHLLEKVSLEELREYFNRTLIPRN
jgi:4'-phosphopantetheinyl transferase